MNHSVKSLYTSRDCGYNMFMSNTSKDDELSAALAEADKAISSMASGNEPKAEVGGAEKKVVGVAENKLVGEGSEGNKEDVGGEEVVPKNEVVPEKEVLDSKEEVVVAKEPVLEKAQDKVVESKPEAREEEVSEEDRVVPLEVLNKKMFLAGSLVTFLVVMATVLLIGLGSKLLDSDSVVEQPAVVEVTPEPTPEATPVPQLSKDEVFIEVLNGSGVAGRAGEVADEFEKLGYEVVGVGNGPSVGSTEIRVASEFVDKLDEFFVDASEVLGTEEVVESFDDDRDYLVQVVLGE